MSIKNVSQERMAGGGGGGGGQWVGAGICFAFLLVWMICGGGGFEETVMQLLILTSVGVGNYVADRLIQLL